MEENSKKRNKEQNKGRNKEQNKEQNKGQNKGRNKEQNKEQQDRKRHGTEEFPLAIYDDHVPYSVFQFTHWHWHNALQFCLMKKGSVYFQINHSRIRLEEGEALFINSGQMHKTSNESGEECCYLCFSLEPGLLYGYPGSIINTRYINPVLRDREIAYCHMNKSQKWHASVIQRLEHIYELYPLKNRELDIHILFLEIWSELYKNKFQTADRGGHRIDDRIKSIIAYIEKHYQEKIVLEDIAKEAGFAREYCCREFKRNMNCSIFTYINDFRLLKSMELLNTNLSITEIAEQCGFCSTSFYIKKFKEKTGAPPNVYRKRIT